MFDAAAFIASLPAAPGVYRMLDASGRVLYVGKARDLRRRVASYFGARAAPSARIAQMVRRVASMQATPVASESEALVLERSLIRTLGPHYNIQFRDDSSYPYLVLTDETWPRLLVRRRPLPPSVEAFGPYPAAARAFRAADLLRKAFRIRPCDDATFAHRTRPCLQHAMGRCSAPCVGLIERGDYSVAIDEARRVLRGDAGPVRRELVARMQRAAAQLDFERAAVLRDRIADLATVTAQQSVDDVAIADTDVIAVAERHDARLLAIGMLRSGRWVGERLVEAVERTAGGTEDGVRASVAELVEALLLAEHAGPATPGARRVVLPEGVDVDGDVLATLAVHGVSVVRRPSPALRRWRTMTREAAELQLRSRELRTVTQRERAARLAEALGLRTLLRIECFDVSHTGGERAVAGCVVWEGGMKRTDYRRFNVSPVVAGDDYAALEEAVRRRFDDSRADEAVRPQLLVVDGGAGQVERARRALARLDVELPVLGLSKGPRRVVGEEVLHRGWAGDALRLPPSHPGLLLLQQIRDEAHRFALAGHRARRERARVADPLDAIPGLGPVRRKALLQAFGGRDGVKGASVEALARIERIGPALARAIWRGLHGV